MLQGRDARTKLGTFPGIGGGFQSFARGDPEGNISARVSAKTKSPGVERSSV
jgi:hypothetical protein